jgi:hypothetical protein
MRSELYELIASIEAETGESSATAMAGLLLERLQKCAADGDKTAGPKLRQIGLHGATSVVRDWFAPGRVMVGYNGSTHRIAARVGVPVEVRPEEDEDGEEPDPAPVQWQHPMLFELSWAEFEAHLARLRKSVQRVSAELLIKEAIGNLHAQYPASATPLEAMKLAGIDPASFQLSDQHEIVA